MAEALTRDLVLAHNQFMHKGQALVVVLLALAIVLTLGLSIASRNVTEIGVSTTQEESARALSAAEAGLEAALGGVAVGASQIPIGNQGASYQVSTVNVTGGEHFNFPDALTAGEAVTLFLALHNSDGSAVLPPAGTFPPGGRIYVCWGDPALSAQPALTADLYYYSAGSYRVKRAAIDPLGNRFNQFSAANSTPSNTTCPPGSSYRYAADFNNLIAAFAVTDPSPQPMFMRLRMWYNQNEGHHIGVRTTPGTNFPLQGTIIESTGRAGDTARKVQVFARYPDLPDIIDFAVFSGQDAIK